MASRARAAKTSTPVERRREISAGGLIWRRNPAGAVEVVLIKPAGKEFWALPKGHVEEGESVAEAAVREVREETGLSVGDVKPLGDISYIFSSRDRPGAPLVRIFKRVHFFLMQLRGGDTSAHDGEIEQVKWFPLAEAIDQASFENERRLIAKAEGMLSEARRRPPASA